MIPQFVPHELYTRTDIRLRMTDSYTNVSSSGYTAQQNAIRPTTVGDYMLFDGTKSVRYSHQDAFQATAPYSLELDVYIEAAGSGKIIATNGDGFGSAWGEWAVIQEANAVMLYSSSDNNGYQLNQVLIPNYMIKRWYRIGFSFYLKDNVLYCKGFLNGLRTFDTPCAAPYNTANGLSFGADWTYTSTSSPSGSKIRTFNGRLRNITILPILEKEEIPPVVGTNPPEWAMGTGNLGTFGEDTDINIPLLVTDQDNNITKYEVINGSLPGGLTLNATSGVIAGRLAEVTTDTVYTFTVKVTDSTNLFITGSFSINVANTKTTVTWETSNSQDLAQPAPGEPVIVNLVARSN